MEGAGSVEHKRRPCAVADGGRQGFETSRGAHPDPAGSVGEVGYRGAGSAARVVECLKSAGQIGLEILDILKADMEPNGRTTRRPCRRCAITGAVERNDEAFK